MQGSRGAALASPAARPDGATPASDSTSRSPTAPAGLRGHLALAGPHGVTLCTQMRRNAKHCSKGRGIYRGTQEKAPRTQDGSAELPC